MEWWNSTTAFNRILPTIVHVMVNAGSPDIISFGRRSSKYQSEPKRIPKLNTKSGTKEKFLIYPHEKNKVGITKIL